MDEKMIITLLSVAVSVLMFIITYMYAMPLKQMIQSIKECVQEIKASMEAMRSNTTELRSDVDRLKDHEKTMWKKFDELQDEIKTIREAMIKDGSN